MGPPAEIKRFVVACILWFRWKIPPKGSPTEAGTRISLRSVRTSNPLQSGDLRAFKEIHTEPKQNPPVGRDISTSSPVAVGSGSALTRG